MGMSVGECVDELQIEISTWRDVCLKVVYIQYSCLNLQIKSQSMGILLSSILRVIRIVLIWLLIYHTGLKRIFGDWRALAEYDGSFRAYYLKKHYSINWVGTDLIFYFLRASIVLIDRSNLIQSMDLPITDAIFIDHTSDRCKFHLNFNRIKIIGSRAETALSTQIPFAVTRWLKWIFARLDAIRLRSYFVPLFVYAYMVI